MLKEMKETISKFLKMLAGGEAVLAADVEKTFYGIVDKLVTLEARINHVESFLAEVFKEKEKPTEENKPEEPIIKIGE